MRRKHYQIKIAKHGIYKTNTLAGIIIVIVVGIHVDVLDYDFPAILRAENYV